MATQNTILSDINELYTGYVLSGNTWATLGPDAKNQFNKRCAEAQPDEVKDAIGKSVVMAEEFLKWAHANKYGALVDVWWTARAGSMSAAVNRPVDQSKNPTDILVKFGAGPANGFLGLSAKATKGKGDIGFKNPGVGTVDRSLNLQLASYYDSRLKQTIKNFNLPDTASKRKDYLRENPGIKTLTENIGTNILSELRDKLLVKLLTLSQPKLFEYLLSDWMDANVMYPPYIKVTGKGNKAPYEAVVSDPTDNPKLKALGNYPITLEKVGNDSIGVKAGDKKIMKIRFKFESEKMASSMKLSGDPW